MLKLPVPPAFKGRAMDSSVSRPYTPLTSATARQIFACARGQGPGADLPAALTYAVAPEPWDSALSLAWEASPASATPGRSTDLVGVNTYSEFCLLAVFGDQDNTFQTCTYWTAPAWFRGLGRDWLARYADHCGHQDDSSV